MTTILFSMKFFTKYPYLNILGTLIFLSLPFERLLTIEVYGFTLKMSYIFAILFIVVALITFAKKKLTLRAEEIVLGLFILVSFLSAFQAVDPKRTIMISSLFLLMGLIYFFLRRFLPRDSSFYRQIFIFTAFACSIFALWQFFADVYDLPFSFLRDAYTKQNFGFPRVQATFLEPLYFANYLLIALYFNIFELLQNPKNKRILTISLFFIALAFFLTLSRGAFWGFVASALMTVFGTMYFAKSYLRRLMHYLAIILISFVFTLAFVKVFSVGDGLSNYLSQLVKSEKLTSVFLSALSNNNTRVVEVSVIPDNQNELTLEAITNRDYTTKVATQTILKNPLGIGVGNFGLLPEFKDVLATGSYQTVNNLYLEILVENGYIGLILFITFLFIIAVELLKKVMRKDLVSIFYLVTFLALFIQYLTFSTLYIIYIWVFLALFRGETDSVD